MAGPDGDLALQSFIARVRKLGALPASVAKRAAPLVEAELRASAEAGVTPDGTPWPPKKDGGRALPNAATALSARAVGSTVVVSLKGPYVLHNIGEGHAPRRQLLPDRGTAIPKNIAAALDKAAAEEFRRAMGGG